MKTTAILACLVAFASTGRTLAQPPEPIKPLLLQEAASKPLGLIQKSQAEWDRAAPDCVSCHHQILPEFVQSEARGRGIEYDATLARATASKTFAHFRDLDLFVQGYQHIDVMDEAWRLFAAHAAGVPASLTTSAIAQFLASAQRADGGWRTMDARPPQSHSRFTATALCARGVALYLPDSFREERQAVLRRAREWLLKEQPRSTEDHVFRLLGLLWTGAEEGVRKNAAERLLVEQFVDGGWAQVRGGKSDAYSTGEALYSLHQATGLKTDDPVYRKGLQFLLKTQDSNGSWKVESRLHESLPVSPEYFSAGFPHGRKHQFSSIAGTAWATAAVLQALPVAKAKPNVDPLPNFAPQEEKEEWVRMALNGTAADLKAALAKGMDPKARTKAGTTALMLATRDPKKVAVLLEAGADVNARADSGFTALLVAARFHGNAEVVGLLLKKGAEVSAPKELKVRNDATSLFVATSSGDVAVVRLLLKGQADVEADMQVLGGIATSPLVAAVTRGDTAMVDALLQAKADPNRGNAEKTSPLHRAVVANHADAVKALLAGGAKVNQADREGFTALHSAAYVDFPDTTVVELLVAAGADFNAKDKTDRTPLEVAKALNRPRIVEVLIKKSPK